MNSFVLTGYQRCQKHLSKSAPKSSMASGWRCQQSGLVFPCLVSSKGIYLLWNAEPDSCVATWS